MDVNFKGIAYFESTFKEQIGKNGEIKPREFVFRSRFGEEGGELPVEADRYRLIWMPGCPHAHKVIITWKLLGLDRVISLGTAGIFRTPTGWVFSEDKDQVDPVLGMHSLHELYLKTDPDFTGRSTVPALIDVKSRTVANNDHYHIPIYFNLDWKKYHKKGAPDLYPEALRGEIDELNTFVFQRIIKGFYRVGFARSQDTLDREYKDLFEALDTLDSRLSDRRFLFGDYITDTDIRLYPSLVRFRQAYYQVFRANRNRLDDFENLWAYTRDLYQTECFGDTTYLDLIKKHYQMSPHLRPLWGNVHGLYCKGPDDNDWNRSTGREKLSGKKEKFLEKED